MKNNNAQAILEKKRKILSNLAIDLGQKLMPVLTVSTSGFTYFVKAVSVLTDFAIRNSGAIIRLTASIAAYTIASKLTTLWVNRQTQATLAQIIVTKARAFAEGASAAITHLYAAATMLLTGNVKGATQAVRAFNTVIKVSPMGLLIGLLTLAAGAMISFWNRTEEVVSQGMSLTKEIIRLQKEKTEQIIREKNELNGLVSQIMLTNENSAVRKELISQLQTLYPDFLKYLDAEKVTNQQLAGQLSIVNARYREKARIAALSAKSEAITKKMTDNESSILEAQEYLKTHRTPNLDPRSPEAMEIQANINAVKRLTRENENYLIVLENLDKKIIDLKNQNNANSEDWWTQKIVELTWTIAGTKRLMDEAKNSNDYLSFQNLSLDLEDYNKQLLVASQNLQNLQKKKPAGDEPSTSDPFDPILLSGDSPKTPPKWSLNSDISFLRESLKLKQDYGNGLIQSEEELNKRLRDLEIRFLKERIRSGKESGEALLDIQQQLADRFIEMRKEREKREDNLDDAITKGMSPVDRENQEYEERLIELKLFGIAREQLTETELCALEALEKEHLLKLSKLDADAMKEEIENRQRSYEAALTELQLANANELNAITSLEQAKQILSASFSNEELQKIRSLDKAKKLIREQSALKEQEFTRTHLEALLKTLQEVMGTGEWEGLSLSDAILSPEEKQVLTDRINEVKKLLSGLTAGADDLDPKSAAIRGMSTDILGFSQDDWDILLKNLEDGKIGINDLIMGVKALGSVWASYYDAISAKEQAQLNQFENGIDEQKQAVQDKFDQNLISQEAYNFQVTKLDEELDRKKAEFEYRNAVRARNMAIMNAIVNTATAVTSALTVAPPLGIILAGIVGTMGAFQIGTILQTPLPELPGREEGGYLKVRRSQDGRLFRAKNNPGKRGYVSTPTIIAGEKPGSSEYVVSDDAVNNPTIRPVIDILEMARLNGNLSTINLPAILESTRTLSGRQQGGYISDITGTAPGKPAPAATPVQDPALLEIIRQNTLTMAALNKELQKGIQSKVALHGRGGLYDAMNEDALLRKNANL